MDDRVDRGVEKIAIVADHDDGARIAREIALEPERAFEVEIVGRLVEQEQVGLGEEQGGERDAHAPAAGKVRAGPRLRRGVEAEAGEDARRARLRRMRVDIAEPCVQLGDAVRIGGALRFVEQLGALAVGGQHGLDQRLRSARRFLLDAADARALRQRNRSGVGRNLAGDGAKERRLARAVAADEARLRSLGQGQARALDKRASGDPEREVGDLQAFGDGL